MAISINGATGISGVDGSAATPAVQGSDTNTGISFGTDTVSINTGGTARATVDSSGRLLAGTTSAPSVGDSQYALVSIQGNTAGSTGDSFLSLRRGQAPASISSGAGLGTIVFGANDGSPYATIAGNTDGSGGSGDYPGRLVFSTTANSASSPTERMRITNDGFITFLNADTSANTFGTFFHPPVNVTTQPSILYFSKTHSGTVSAVVFKYNGATRGAISYDDSSTTYATTSDYRLKENIASVTDGISRLRQLKPSRFNFVTAPDKTVDGFIAHEVQAVVPEAITGEKDAVDDEGNPVYQGIDQSKLVPLLTAALQEAIAKIESLEARLTTLEGGTN